MLWIGGTRRTNRDDGPPSPGRKFVQTRWVAGIMGFAVEVFKGPNGVQSDLPPKLFCQQYLFFQVRGERPGKPEAVLSVHLVGSVFPTGRFLRT